MVHLSSLRDWAAVARVRNARSLCEAVRSCAKNVDAIVAEGAACPKPAQCLNRGRLVLDADSVVFLLNGAVLFVREAYPELHSWDQKMPMVKNTVHDVFSLFRMCAEDSLLHVSEVVLTEELDLVTPCSSVRKWLEGSELRNVTRRHRRQLQSVLSRELSAFPADNAMMEALRLQFSPAIRPADRDAAVLLAACEIASDGYRTLLLAHDHGYDKPIRQLRRDSDVTLAGGMTLSTAELEHVPYEGFLVTAHDSCCLDSERFKCLAQAFYGPQWYRSVRVENSGLARRIVGEVLPFVEMQTRSIMAKGRGPMSSTQGG